MLLLCVVFVCFLLAKRAASLETSEFYYQSPIYPIDNPSVTIGSVRSTSSNSNFSDLILSFNTGILTAAFCQINFINRGLAGPKIKGNLNLKIIEYFSPEQTGQYATQRLLDNSLYNVTTKQPIVAGNDSEKLGVYLNSQAIGNTRLGYGETSGFGIPFLNYGSSGLNGFENQLVSATKSNDTLVYSFRRSANFTMTNAVLQVLAHFNWTLVGNFFEDSEYGSRMLSLVQERYPSQSPKPAFVCLEQGEFSLNLTLKESTIVKFCNCIKRFDKVNVVITWGSLNFANSIADGIDRYCPELEKLMYLAADDSDLIFPTPTQEFYLENMLWINSLGNQSFAEYLNECYHLFDDDPKQQQLYAQLVQGLTQFARNCKAVAEAFDPEDTKYCNTEDFLTVFNQDITSGQYFYAVDAITGVAEAIYLLQNNCTYLNEIVQVGALAGEAGVNFKIDDFCSLTKFAPSTIAVVMRYIKFTGYTGEISFVPSSLFRNIKSYYLYNIGDSISNNSLVGLMSQDLFYINDSLIFFPNNNQTPVSKIIVDDPTLSDAVVAVFFGLFIFLLVFTIAVFIAYICLRDTPKIRKNTPRISYVILSGIVLVDVALIISCMPKSDATCYLIYFITYTGVSWIIGGVLAKNYRIYRIFSNHSASAIDIKDWKLFLFILFVWVYFMLLVGMYMIAGLGAYEFTSPTNPFYVWIACTADSSFWRTFFRILLTGSKLIYTLIAAILCILTWKVPAAYSEGRQLAICVYTVVAVGIVITPLYFVLGTNTYSETFRFVVKSEMSLLMFMALLCVLFLPNVYIGYRQYRRGITR